MTKPPRSRAWFYLRLFRLKSKTRGHVSHEMTHFAGAHFRAISAASASSTLPSSLTSSFFADFLKKEERIERSWETRKKQKDQKC